jgi:hypothetical protein
MRVLHFAAACIAGTWTALRAKQLQELLPQMDQNDGGTGAVAVFLSITFMTASITILLLWKSFQRNSSDPS